MTEPIDERFVRALTQAAEPARDHKAEAARGDLMTLFTAQAQSRHVDSAARWLRSHDWGFYTIGSSGHESNAAVAMALRPSDPALLHYRSGGFYAARAAQVPGSTGVRDVLLGLAGSVDDPISGGRHKVFGHPDLAIIPQTSTIASHLPRAVGVAFGLDARRRLGAHAHWPDDAVVVCSFGDASANHSTATGALNAAGYLRHRGVPLPLLFVCEDNGLGISVPTPPGWLARSLPGYGLDYVHLEGDSPVDVLERCRGLVDQVRDRRRPAILHLRTVRLGGHAGSDAEVAYRTSAQIEADHARDPLLATATALMAAGVPVAELLRRYRDIADAVRSHAESMRDVRRLESAGQVMAPLTARRPVQAALASRQAPARPLHPDQVLHRSPTTAADAASDQTVAGEPLTLAQAINATLADVLTAHPNAIVFGEDVGDKGGVYGVTRGLTRRFGGRVFNTLLDEQTILGTALGTALTGFLPLPEIQYLAYLHNAEDQLRGEAASLRFFSAGQYGNGMVLRIAGLAYQKGFGGHFHNDNSVAVLRDIPGIVLVVPAHPADAPGLLRTCVGLAVAEQRVCVIVEPIARYHTRDLFDGDGGWLAPYSSSRDWDPRADGQGRIRLHGDGTDLLIVTYGNGLFLSLRALRRLAQLGITVTVLDLRWLTPLPAADLAATAERFDQVLVVDEGRRSGGVAESVIAALADARYDGAISRVTSHDSYIPLGPAADTVLLSEDDIVEAAVSLTTNAT